MEEEIYNLYEVTIKKGISYYVIAMGLDEAYKKVRENLDKNNLFFVKEREFKEIKFMASTYPYSERQRLYI